MEYRQLGQSNLGVSTVAFGCWQMGGRYWGRVEESETVAAVQRALDLGINLFDNADIYGLGHAEDVLAKALGSRRTEAIIATKVGWRWDEDGNTAIDLSRKHILEAVEGSLRRLKTDYIDLYQTHLTDSETPVEETVKALCDCVSSGKVRYIGVSNVTAGVLQDYLPFGRIESLQPPYNMLRREIEIDLLPLCAEKRIGVIVYEPLARGLLTGKFSATATFNDDDLRKNDRRFQGKQLIKNLAVVEKLKQIAKDNGKTVAQLAVAWVLSQPGVTAAICGVKRSSQIEECAGGSGWKLSGDELKAIDNILASE
jgi:aryl-alcohol dehydrogenase-like predicted oxidoreductase